MTGSCSCPECGARLPHDAPKGLCPRCLMGAAMAQTTAHRPGSPAPQVAVDLEGFRRAAVEAGLVEEAEFDRNTSGPDGDGGATLAARELVRLGMLSPYQAGALLQGKGRGLIIGSYLVLDRLGRGGMGVVFKARHRRDGRVVALKILPPSFGRDPEAVARFRREFELAAGLRHPNVVPAIDAAEDRGVAYLAMEYVDGEDLDALVSAVGPLPIKLAINCAIQAATGLAAAHARGIVHRDIKPANLMLDASGTVRVLDLGLARVMEATNPLNKGTAASLTQSGAYMGTVDYMAPEQADDSKKADQRADIYSLGCTLHFLLTGRAPFGGDTALKRLMAHQSQPAPSLRASRDDVLAPLEATYQTMMAKKPADRPRSMAEVIEMLEGCRSASGDAREARAGLKRAFAETVMKRAVPRGRDRPRDASIFARAKPDDGPVLDPDLRFEDLVMDLRPEHRPKPLAEEDLPPVLPRLAPQRKRSRRRVPAGLAWSAAAFVLVVAALVLWRRREPDQPSPAPLVTAKASAKLPEPAGPGWRLLFDGKDLAGWRRVGLGDHPEAWSVEDGALVGRGVESMRTGLFAPGSYSDFGFRFEYQTSPKGDGGALLFNESRTGTAFQVEFNIRDTDVPEGATGDYVAWDEGGGRRRSPCDPPARPLKGEGAWNLMEIERRGGQLSLALNGRILHTGRDGGTGPRLVGFQALSGVVRYRNVQIKELPAATEPEWQPLFNGRDLAGWRSDRGNPGLWDVEGGALAARGRGNREQAYLLTDRDFSDFLLRFEVLMPRDADSGIGLWARPGEADMPVEVNLRTFVEHPSLMASVRTARKARPQDYALPDRPARLRADGQWDAMEVEARGGRLRVRVNGEIVVDRDLGPLASDPDATPAIRRRVGRIGLQAHTGTVRFRKIEVREVKGPPAPTAALAGPRYGRVVYADDFSDPATGWARGRIEHSPGFSPFLRDYEKGVYYAEAGPDWEGTCAMATAGPIAEDFQVEVVGRVLGEGPSAEGGWGLIVVNPQDRGYQVEIDRKGTLTVIPAFWGREKFPNDPSLAPIRHPVIRAGNEWNTMTVRVRKRRAELLVNGVAFAGSGAIDWELTPANIQLCVYKHQAPTRVRAEFDRVEVREILPDAPPPAGATAAFQVGSVWTREEPEGTPTVGTFTVTACDGATFKAIFDLGNYVREVTGTIDGAEIRWSARDVRVIRGNAGHDNHGTIRGESIAMYRVGDERQASGSYVLKLKKR